MELPRQPAGSDGEQIEALRTWEQSMNRRRAFPALTLQAQAEQQPIGWLK
jgi:hypothetical protein